jgi:ABC-type uncharacterized transport system substrate-binding protein
MPVIGALDSTSLEPSASLVAAFQRGLSDTSAPAAKTVTSTIPIVFIVGADPVAAGLVPSLAQPGGNLTGVGLFAVELNAKRIELVSELVPRAAVIALLVNASYSTTEPITVPPLILARANEVIE